MAKDKDGHELSPSELVKELNRVLGIEDVDEEEEDTVTDADENENKKDTAAPFDTSVFDSLEQEGKEITPFEFDEELLGFSDTLDRIFEDDEKKSKLEASEDEITCDFIAPVKETDQTRQADSVESESEAVKEETDEKKHSADTALTGADRVPFNQTYAPDDEAEATDEDGYTEDENEIMDALGDATAIKEKPHYDLDLLYSDEQTEEELLAEQKKRERKKRERAKNRQRTAPGLEYTAPSQKKLFVEHQKRQYRTLNIRIVLASVFAAVILLLESLAHYGVSFPHFMSLDKNPAVYVLILLQLFVLCSALAFTYIADGVKAVFSGNCKTESLTALCVIFTTGYGIFMSVYAKSAAVSSTCFSIPALCVLSTLFAQKRDLLCEIMSFRIASSTRTKYILQSCDISPEDRLNSDVFQYLPDGAKMLKINKTSFVDSFFSRSRSNCRDRRAFNIILPTVLAIFVAVLVITLLTARSVTSAVSNAFTSFCIFLPLGAFSAYSLPFYKLALHGQDIESAIIGKDAVDEFSSASVISFEDKEVFPSYGVKTSDFKQYDTGRVDHTMYVLASVFKKLGGPLGTVFVNTAKELSLTDDVRIISVLDDGIESMVNDDCILLGSASFMEENGLVPHYTSEDEANETSNGKRIMYVASNGNIVAKMSIKYNIDTDFLETLKELSSSGVCIAIKTFDPNIDTGLLSEHIDINKYPIRVLKCTDASQMSESVKNAEGDIISKSSPACLLKLLGMCQRTKNALRTGILSMVLSSVIGVIIICLSLLSNSFSGMSVLYVLLYQIIWIIVSHAVSYFNS